MKKIISYWALILILLLGFIVRLYKIDNPVADWHSWRQADTAAVARNFIKFGFDPLHPRYDDLSNVQSGKDNPQGFRMVEFPFYQILGYTGYKILPRLGIEIWLRLVSIFFSLLSIVFIYKLSEKYGSKLKAIFSAGIFAFLPYSVYYSRAILPEMTAVGLSLGAIYFFNINLLLSILFASFALLVKPTAGFLLLPIVYLFLKNRKKFGILMVLAFIPLFLWRWWIAQYPEGIAAYSWLLNGNNIRFKGAFFRWIIVDRLSRLILGYTGIFFLMLGLSAKSKEKNYLFGSLLLGSILYVVVFATGNVQHDYYQVLLLPVIAMYAGRGLVEAWKLSKVIAVVCAVFMFAFAWYEIRGYYWVNHPEIVEAGRKIDELTPKNAKVIAPYMGDTAFLYQTNRQGWPVTQKPLPEMIQMGADYIVITNPDNDALKLPYQVLYKASNYIIFDLKKTP